MRFGIGVRGGRRTPDGDRIGPRQLVTAAQQVDSLGFDVFALSVDTDGDGAVGYGDLDVVASWVAATTSRIDVAAVGGRSAQLTDPGDFADIADRWATVDALSGGRLDLRFRSRPGMGEGVSAVRRICARWAENAGSDPASRSAASVPLQSPHPPCGLVGTDRAVAFLAGAHRLGVMVELARTDWELIDGVVEAYRRAWDGGRALPPTSPSGSLGIAVPAPPEEAAAVEVALRLLAHGVDEVVFRFDEGEPDVVLGRIRRLGEQGLPLMRREAERLRPSLGETDPPRRLAPHDLARPPE